jgi:hypothetical protein
MERILRDQEISASALNALAGGCASSFHDLGIYRQLRYGDWVVLEATRKCSDVDGEMLEVAQEMRSRVAELAAKEPEAMLKACGLVRQ